jgi:hypothetical protein
MFTSPPLSRRRTNDNDHGTTAINITTTKAKETSREHLPMGLHVEETAEIP